MLRSLDKLEHYKVRATDGDLGSVANFLIDDKHWTVRYLVVQTGGFFGGRRVLVSPISFRTVDYSTGYFHVALTMDKIRNSPSLDLDQPVSRQHERDYNAYYDYPYYWGASGLWGTGYYPGPMSGAGYDRTTKSLVEPAADVTLRSAKEITGYHIEGTDGSIGHVEDFMLDDENWAIRYMVIDTSNWWVGKSVLVAPKWTMRISWSERKVYVDMTRAAIKKGRAQSGQSTIPSAEPTRRHSTATTRGRLFGVRVTRSPREELLPEPRARRPSAPSGAGQVSSCADFGFYKGQKRSAVRSPGVGTDPPVVSHRSSSRRGPASAVARRGGSRGEGAVDTVIEAPGSWGVLEPAARADERDGRLRSRA